MAATIQKREHRQAVLLQRTTTLQGLSADDAMKLASRPPQRCLRLNPLRGAPSETYQHLTQNGVTLHPQPWFPSNVYVITDQEPAGEAALQATLRDGTTFLQNPSSFIPVLALQPQRDDTILDACAAPGGKTSYIAALTENQAELWATDTSYDRLQKLRRVCELLHVTPHECRVVAGEQASKKLPLSYFTKILIDAPCSGEDIRSLQAPDLASWSTAKVKRLAELQKKILKEAWKLLQPGGVLVYSTCSQAPEENEVVINWFLSKHDDAHIAPLPAVPLPPQARPGLTVWNAKQLSPQLTHAVRIPPSTENISFFVCTLQKSTVAMQA